MKIICVGQNYRLHNQEMGRSGESKDPIFFMKPDSALLKDNKPFFIPDFSNNIHHEIEIVIRISRLGKNIAERFAHRYYDQVTLGVDFTARDIQASLKEAGLPWELSKSFDYSAVVGTFVNKEQISSLTNMNFYLLKNGQAVQTGNSCQMLHSIDKIIALASQYFTLKIGDLIFTGTPDGVSKVDVDDHLEGYLENEKVFDFYVR